MKFLGKRNDHVLSLDESSKGRIIAPLALTEIAQATRKSSRHKSGTDSQKSGGNFVPRTRRNSRLNEDSGITPDKTDTTLKRIKKGSLDPEKRDRIEAIKKHLMPLTIVKKTGGPVNPKLKKLKGLKNSILENKGQFDPSFKLSDPFAEPKESDNNSKSRHRQSR